MEGVLIKGKYTATKKPQKDTASKRASVGKKSAGSDEGGENPPTRPEKELTESLPEMDEKGGTAREDSLKRKDRGGRLIAKPTKGFPSGKGKRYFSAKKRGVRGGSPFHRDGV